MDPQMAPGVPVPPQQPDPYAMLMAELQRPLPNGKSAFTPEQQQDRIARNQNQVDLGMLGNMAGDQRIRGMGGGVLKQALADRDERMTNRGITDPLSGETQIDPEYAAEKMQQRRGQILQQALGFQDSRQRAIERQQAQTDKQESRMAEIQSRGVLAQAIAASRGGGRGASGPPLPKLPLGMRYNENGDAEPIPGTPLAEKMRGATEKDNLRRSNAVDRADFVIGKIDEAIGKTTTMNTGVLGRITGLIPESDAYTLERDIDSIKANIGFQELAAMRQASPTGGALGQVAVQELVYLQAALGSLDRSQGKEQLSKNLKSIRKHFDTWKMTVQGAEDAKQSPSPGYPDTGAGSRAQPGAGSSAPRRLRLNPATGELE